MPDGWRDVNLADITSLIRNGFSCNQDKNGFGSPVTRIETISDGTINYERVGFTNAPIDNSYRLKSGDILFSHINSVKHIGKVAIYDDTYPLYHGMNLMLIRCQQSCVNPLYLYYILSDRRAKAYFENHCKQAINQASLNRRDISQFQFTLPPLPEQKKIAAILSSVDDAIQATQAVIDQTRRVKQGVMQQLLTRGIGHTRFKQTEIGEIPEDWGVAKLDDVCEWIGVGIASSTTHAYAKDGIPIIRNQNIKEGYIDSSDLLRINLEFDQNNKTKRIRTGDVLSVRTGYPGLSAVVPPEFDQCHCFTTLISRPNINILKPEYLCWWINSDCGKRFVLSGQAGGAQQNFNVGELRKMPLAIPPKDEQQRIAGIIEDMLKMIQIYEKDIESIRTLKKGLMQDLLTGRVRVKPDEVNTT